jgi:hypothetical protein
MVLVMLPSMVALSRIDLQELESTAVNEYSDAQPVAGCCHVSRMLLVAFGPAAAVRSLTDDGGSLLLVLHVAVGVVNFTATPGELPAWLTAVTTAVYC